MCHVLYCDLTTMPCTASDVERELGKFATAMCRVSSNIWFFDARKGPYPENEFIGLHEYLLDNVLCNLILPDSEVMCFTLDRKSMFQLSDDAVRFFEEHTKDQEY